MIDQTDEVTAKPPELRLVVFDVGGVLVRIAPWAEAHEACGYPLAQLPSLDDFLPRLSVCNRAYDRGEIECREYEARVADASGGKYLPEEVRRIHSAVCAAEFPGLHPLFDALEAAGLETGILSNTNLMHWRRLAGDEDDSREYPLLRRATHRHASYLLKCSKPDPLIYETFARTVRALPAEILFFDDLERNVQAARAAGWQADTVDPHSPTAPQLFALLRARGLLP